MPVFRCTYYTQGIQTLVLVLYLNVCIGVIGYRSSTHESSDTIDSYFIDDLRTTAFFLGNLCKELCSELTSLYDNFICGTRFL